MTDTDSLLKDWRQERAYRVVSSISRIGLFLSIVVTTLDVFFQTPWITWAGDMILILGFAMSVYFTRPNTRVSNKAWPWLYFGLWMACTTSLATTGGLSSPFNGSYWSLLFLGGLLIQVKFRPLLVSCFILANLAAWLFLELAFPNSFGSVPSVTFSFLVNFLVFIALFIFIAEFMKTERDLGRELYRRYQELTKTRENLSRQEEANAAKSTFLANISHELRTPLGAILGYAELMQAPDIDRDQKEKFAETIHRNGLQLSRLVDDLLDLSKAEAGKIEVENTEFKLRNALHEVVDLFQMQAQRKGISLDLFLQDSLPESMVTDPLRMKQILRNILGNAIKFTDRGYIRMTSSVVTIATDQKALQVEIEDTGCGLTAEEQNRIFKAFSQADPSVTRKFGGTGLGLSLSRNLAQLLGGDLRLAWSQKDVGSRFVLQIPIKELAGPKAPNDYTNNTRNFFTTPMTTGLASN